MNSINKQLVSLTIDGEFYCSIDDYDHLDSVIYEIQSQGLSIMDIDESDLDKHEIHLFTEPEQGELV